MSHCARIALVGRPNVGKSTLLNGLVGAGLAAVSQKAQTTRQKVIGIWSDAQTQLVFIDTPGQSPQAGQTLNRILDRNAVSALAEADVIVWLVEALRWTPADDVVAKRLLQRKPETLVVVVNKVDRVKDKARLLPDLARLQADYSPRMVFPMSARRPSDTEKLCAELCKLAPEGPWLYEEDTLTPQSGEFLVTEKIREQLFACLHDELPYKLAVTVDQMQLDEQSGEAQATIWLDRASHKPIVLGKGGRQLGLVRSAAEKTLSEIFATDFHLQLWVKVRAGWADDQAVIRSLGASD